MTLSTTLKASLAVACVVAFAGCTDLKPIQAQIDDLKAQVSKNTSDDQRTASEAAAAQSKTSSLAARLGDLLDDDRDLERRAERLFRRFRRAEHGESGVVDLAVECDGH